MLVEAEIRLDRASGEPADVQLLVQTDGHWFSHAWLGEIVSIRIITTKCWDASGVAFLVQQEMRKVNLSA